MLDGRPIVRCRKHQHRQLGPLLPQIGEQFEPVAARQREIEHDQVGIRLVRERGVRLGRVLCLDEFERRIQCCEHVLQRFLNQRVIVNDEDLHRSPLHEMKMGAPCPGRHSGSNYLYQLYADAIRCQL